MANEVRATHEYRHNPNVNDPNAGGAREAFQGVENGGTDDGRRAV
jgi:hypothetical protein